MVVGVYGHIQVRKGLRAMEEISLVKYEEFTIAADVTLTLINSQGVGCQVALTRPEHCRVYSDDNYLNGDEATFAPYLDFELEGGYVIEGVACIVCMRTGTGAAGFELHYFAESRRHSCNS